MENKLSLTAKKHTPETSVVSLRIPNDLISKIESIAKQTNRFSLCVGAGTLEKSLIYDFMDNIDYDI